MMKQFAFFLSLIFVPVFASAQDTQTEIVEISGTVEAFLPGWGFAYATVQIKTPEHAYLYGFYPENAKLFFSNFKYGDPITIKARVHTEARKKAEELIKSAKRRIPNYFNHREEVLEVLVNGKWIKITHEDVLFPGFQNFKVMLEKKVVSEFLMDGIRYALIFEDGVVAYDMYGTSIHSVFRTAKVGQPMSFMGAERKIRDTDIFPTPNTKRLLTFYPLTKAEGNITSFLTKENYVYLGFVLKTESEDLRLAFPSDRAKEVKRMTDAGSPVIVYYDGSFRDAVKNQSPTAHAIIMGTDTIFFNDLFYGGADVKHEHLPVKLAGKITRINKTERGNIMSVILDSKIYIEIDITLSNQLAAMFTRGRIVGVEGEERIKLSGEIYEKDYRIITPKKLIIEGKEFITNQ